MASIVKETCTAIQEIVMPKYLPKITRELWETTAHEFFKKWQMPNCVGALDGKHVNIFAPNNTGSLYYNYKKQFSLVLMALVDANYKYLMIDVGSYGSNSDGGIFANCPFGKAWVERNNSLSVPEDRPLPGTETNLRLPLVIVADEAFPLKHNILRPFPGKNLTQRQRTFNYRLSRARRVVECTFGITSHVWRILLKRMEVSVDFATLITVACCTLHNFLISTNSDAVIEHYVQSQQDEITEESRSLSNNITGRFSRPTAQAMEIRNLFADWFISPAGSLPFQN